MIVTLIPAAGTSSRMRGRDKLLETLRGTPILRHVAEQALKADFGPVIVTLPPKAPARHKALQNLPLSILTVADAQTGMSASLRAGAKAALDVLRTQGPDTHHGLFILLPDMPEIEAADLTLINQSFQKSGGPILRATTEDGTPGHPVLFPDHLLNQFARIKGDTGAKHLLKTQPIHHFPLSGTRATLDLDTPEDWAAWRADTNTPA